MLSMVNTFCNTGANKQVPVCSKPPSSVSPMKYAGLCTYIKQLSGLRHLYDTHILSEDECEEQKLHIVTVMWELTYTGRYMHNVYTPCDCVIICHQRMLSGSTLYACTQKLGGACHILAHNIRNVTFICTPLTEMPTMPVCDVVCSYIAGLVVSCTGLSGLHSPTVDVTRHQSPAYTQPDGIRYNTRSRNSHKTTAWAKPVGNGHFGMCSYKYYHSMIRGRLGLCSPSFTEFIHSFAEDC